MSPRRPDRQTLHRRLCHAARGALVALGLLGAAAPAAAAQGFFQKLAGATMDMAMRTAPVTDLEARGLPTLAVGGLQLGVSKVAVKDSTGVRLQAYLFNPGAEAVMVPAPDRGLFALVDDKGRRMPLVLAPRVERHAGGPITVPAMERVAIVLLFGAPAADAQAATLKVGAVGMIAGIPLRGGAGGGDPAAAGGGTVWTQPAAGPAPAAPAQAPPAPSEPPPAPPPPAAR